MNGTSYTSSEAKVRTVQYAGSGQPARLPLLQRAAGCRLAGGVAGHGKYQLDDDAVGSSEGSVLRSRRFSPLQAMRRRQRRSRASMTSRTPPRARRTRGRPAGSTVPGAIGSYPAIAASRETGTVCAVGCLTRRTTLRRTTVLRTGVRETRRVSRSGVGAP